MQPDNSSRLSTSLFYVALLVVFVLHAVYLSCIAEDSHITFRYAKNLAAGYGFVWNAGDAPVEGYTNFLWVVITAGIIKLGLDLFTISKVLGIAAALGTIEITRRFSTRLLGVSPGIALIPCLLLAASGPLATWAGSGMETTLFGFTLVAACYFFSGYWKTGAKSELILAFLATLLATLFRPEGLMVLCLLTGMSLVMGAGRMRKTLVDLIVPLLVYIVPFALYFGWRIYYFGDPLPNTFYAKTGGGLSQYLRGIQYLGNFSVFYLLPLMLPLLLIAWEAGLPRWKPASSLTALRTAIRENAGLSVCAVIIAFYLAYIVYVGGDYMAMYRFVVPVLPLIYIPLAPASEALWSRITESPRKRFLALLTACITAAATAFHSTPMEETIFQKPGRQHGHYRGVQTERWHVERLSEIGRFFDKYKRSSSESLATRAIGAIAYYADMQIHDMTGLTDPYIAHKEIEGLGTGWAGHEKMDLDYSFKRLPTYIMFDRNLQQDPSGLPVPEGQDVDIALLIETNYPRGQRFADWIRKNPEFVRNHYRLKSVWMVDEANDEEGYFSFLELTGNS